MVEININKTDPYKNWFFFTLLYLIIDYCRPQDIFPPLGYLKPGMIVTLFLAGFLILKHNLKEARSKQTRMLWLFIILLGVYIPFARNNYYAFMATRNMLLFMPFILSVMICVNSIERLKKLIFIFIGTMVYVAIYGFFHHGTGSGNYFADENDIALYLNMWIPVCFFLLFTEKKWKIKIVYIIGLAIGVIVVIISASRGGFVGLISVAFVAWLYSPKKIPSLIIMSLLALMIYAYAGDAYWARIATTTETNEGTAHGRILSWEAGWHMFLANPLGVGGENFPVRFEEYQSGEFKRGMWGRVAHSLWFTLIPELGIFGIIIYFTLLYFNIKDLTFLANIQVNNDPDLRYLNSLSRAFMASFAGYFVSGTFLSVLYYSHYWYLTGILVAMKKISERLLLGNRQAQESASPVSSRYAGSNKKDFEKTHVRKSSGAEKYLQW
jgi:probable O-glycosylation ligase (exosortase A-associated)